MDILTNFNYQSDQDFFESNPQLEITFGEIKDLYPDSYTKVMWAIALDAHPKSIYRNVSTQERRGLIEKEYLNESIKWKELESYIETFNKLVLTQKERFLVEWEKKLEERQQFIAAIPYNEETYEILDKMMASTEKMWKQYLICLKDVSDEAKEQTQGNFVESASESGQI